MSFSNDLVAMPEEQFITMLKTDPGLVSLKSMIKTECLIMMVDPLQFAKNHHISKYLVLRILNTIKESF